MTDAIGPVQKAFFEQQRFTEAEADAYHAALDEVEGHNMTQAMMQLAQSQSILERTNPTDFPTQLKPGEINGKTEAHPNFANYDHSLDQCRSKKLGLKKMEYADGEEDSDGISMGTMGSQDV
jgi:hypothetical protein